MGHLDVTVRACSVLITTFLIKTFLQIFVCFYIAGILQGIPAIFIKKQRPPINQITHFQAQLTFPSKIDTRSGNTSIKALLYADQMPGYHADGFFYF